jgi:thioredoxin 1
MAPERLVLAPILRELAAEQSGRLKVLTVDGDAEAALAARYCIKAFPTVIAFSGGQEVARHVGLTTKTRLAKMVLGGDEMVGAGAMGGRR